MGASHSYVGYVIRKASIQSIPEIVPIDDVRTRGDRESCIHTSIDIFSATCFLGNHSQLHKPINRLYYVLAISHEKNS